MAGRYADEEYARRKAAAEGDGGDGETDAERGDGEREKADWPALIFAASEIAKYAGPPAMALIRSVFARRLCPACGAAQENIIEGQGHVG